MKIFTSKQIRQIDDYTIKHEPVASADLMERAAGKMLEWYIGRFEISTPLFIFVGPGNNGGDGLALARLLSESNYRPEVFSVEISDRKSADWEHNMKRLQNETSVTFITISAIEQFPDISPGSVIIDAIFGSGLSRPADGLAADVIRKINLKRSSVISIDIPPACKVKITVITILKILFMRVIRSVSSFRNSISCFLRTNSMLVSGACCLLSGCRRN